MFTAAHWASRLATLALVFAPAAQAGTFEVNPIRVDLTGAQRNAALTVKNSGTDAVVVQVSVMTWSQQDGRDVLANTDEILISPPIATIQPDREQIIRVGLRRAPDAKSELSYRLFLQEVPPPPQPGFQGLQVALRVGLPIFVQPRQGPAKATLVWDAQLRDPELVNLTLHNRGTGHIQISDVELYHGAEKDPLAAQSSLVYVLPGQSREWALKLRRSGVTAKDRVRLKVSTDAGAVDTDIGLAP
jgi:fimbrial chaperone protein